LQHLGGQHCEQSLEIAAALFHKAADQGFAPAQEHLGECYSLGKGVVKNAALGFEWAHKAGEGGVLEGALAVSRTECLCLYWLTQT
jgi:TPR repeat protein